jgi:hypothetical protein
MPMFFSNGFVTIYIFNTSLHFYTGFIYNALSIVLKHLYIDNYENGNVLVY